MLIERVRDPGAYDVHELTMHPRMLVAFGSGERTPAEFEELASAAGLSVVHIRPRGWACISSDASQHDVCRHHGATPTPESMRLGAAVCTHAVPDTAYWIAAETFAVKLIRRYPRTELDLSTDDVDAYGYWRNGVTSTQVARPRRTVRHLVRRTTALYRRRHITR